jgi:hypothetical protein
VRLVCFALVAIASLAGCLLGMSSHCGDDYTRNMTYLQSGWYRVVKTDLVSTDPLSRVHAIRIQKDPDSQTIVVETDDGQSARYRVPLVAGNNGTPASGRR